MNTSGAIPVRTSRWRRGGCAALAALALVATGCGSGAQGGQTASEGGVPEASSPAADGSGAARPDASPAPDATGAPDAGTATPDAGEETGTPRPPPPPGDSGTAPPLAGPCPPLPQPCLILPMGDSITFGMRATATGHTSIGGYRRYLEKSLLAAGKVFEYVGGCPGFSGRCRIPPDGDPPYCFDGGAPELGRHDGHPGWDINAFRARQGESCPGSVATFLSRVTDNPGQHVTPDIVLLMVGANDVRAGSGIRDGAALRFRYLLDEMLAALPGSTRIVVGLVTPNLNGTNNKDGVIPYNHSITSVVKNRRAAGFNVRLVNTYSAIHIDANGTSPDLSSDHLHPNEQGYKKIAAVWDKAIEPWVRGP